MGTTTLNMPLVEERATTRSIPIYIYAAVLSSISIIVGLIWDISWHTSVGRDGLFSPPHLSIYFGGVLAGLFSGFEVLRITFAGKKDEKNRSLKFWGIFYGSLGPMFCIWGAFAMLTSAPFDDWWHNTYGLDVTILSPPHTVLALGMITIQFGAMVSVLSFQNQMRMSGHGIGESQKRTLTLLFALSSGFFLCMLFTISSEYLGRHDMHGVLFYQVASLLFPLLLVAVSRSSLGRWGATTAAVVYSIVLILTNWTLQLFPAEPLLGPVLNHITRFQPFQFPLLLVVPAVIIDLITQRFSNKNAWLQALIYGAAFLISFIAVQWPFGDFLMTEYARGWVFGSYSWYFGANPDWEFRYAFAPWMESTGMVLVQGLGIALVIAFLSARVGMSWGKWMKNVYR